MRIIQPAALALLCLGSFCGTSLAQQSHDQEQIQQLIPAYLQAWDRGDAQALAGFFASDGDLMIPTGAVFRGPANIAAFYASAFDAGYRGSKAEGKIERLRFVSPDVAVGDGAWSITGAHDRSGSPVPAEHGVFTVIVCKQGDKWRISALREQTGATKLQVTGD